MPPSAIFCRILYGPICFRSFVDTSGVDSLVDSTLAEDNSGRESSEFGSLFTLLPILSPSDWVQDDEIHSFTFSQVGSQVIKTNHMIPITGKRRVFLMQETVWTGFLMNDWKVLIAISLLVLFINFTHRTITNGDPARDCQKPQKSVSPRKLHHFCFSATFNSFSVSLIDLSKRLAFVFRFASACTTTHGSLRPRFGIGEYLSSTVLAKTQLRFCEVILRQ